MKKCLLPLVILVVLCAMLLPACGPSAPAAPASTAPIRIGLILDSTGFLEYYAKECTRGFELGLKYATGGTNAVKGRTIQLIKEDTQLKPDLARQKAQKLIDEDKVDFLVGSISSVTTLAIAPLALEAKKPLIVSGATASSITGANWNQYIFRINRNNLQDSVAWGVALGEKGRKVAIFAEDSAGAHEGMDALKAVLKTKGTEVVYEVYAPTTTTDYTPMLQKTIAAKPYECILWWAGANNPWKQMTEAFRPAGIKITTSILDISSLQSYKGNEDILTDMMGFYYYEWHKNDVNNWFVKEYQALYKDPPTYSTEVGFAAAQLLVAAVNKTNGSTDSAALVKAMEGMKFATPKGEREMRVEDHQALQEMFTCHLVVKPDVAWPVPILDKVLSAKDCAPAILNKR